MRWFGLTAVLFVVWLSLSGYFQPLLLIMGLVCSILVAFLAARDAAVWLGGWGLLLLGQPVVTIGLLCLVFGLAMRWLPSKQPQTALSPAKLQYRFAARDHLSQ